MTANVVTTQQTTARTGTTTRRNRTKHSGSDGRAAVGRTRPTTAEELFTLPEGEMQYELVRGQLREVPMAGWQHGWIEMNIILALATDPVARTVGRTVSGDTAFVLARDPDTVRIPDVAFVRHERLPPPLVSGRAALPPDLAVEIRSPNDRPGELRQKLADYFAAGVQLVWLVDPDEQTVEVWTSSGLGRRCTAAETIDGGAVIPGFRCPVARFFEGTAGTSPPQL